MIDIMNWGYCERKFIKKVEVDEERIKSIVEKAMQRLDRAKKTQINPNTISFIVEDYYEVIKELLVAYLLKNGLRSKNYQCLISYFYKENPNYEKEAYLISQMSFFRNRLSYYGEDIPMEFYEKNKKEFQSIIDLLKKLIGYIK
ncbi:MAG: hypothetical protein KKF48_02505 [Nanoarchaeota archaeon]|nr:hypothetical protein [Nanoarchaeota archaeon]MBU1027892.1 hypothetical protein [Nanoarchaeota archaeon]